jgi:hypothetical protein
MTRCWFITPRLLCKQHLSGPWKEMFQLVGSNTRGYSIQGYLDKKLVSTINLNEYANQVREECLRRGWKVKPWNNVNLEQVGEIDLSYNLLDLTTRCESCKNNMLNIGNKK